MDGCIALSLLRCTCLALPEALPLPASASQIMRNAYQPLPSHFSRQFSQLVGAMLRSDPDERPGAIQLLQLPFVRTHAERLVAQGSVPAINGLLTELLELPADMSAVRLERPTTAVSSRAPPRPKTGKSNKSRKSSKSNKSKKLGKTQYLQAREPPPWNAAPSPSPFPAWRRIRWIPVAGSWHCMLHAAGLAHTGDVA